MTKIMIPLTLGFAVTFAQVALDQGVSAILDYGAIGVLAACLLAQTVVLYRTLITERNDHESTLRADIAELRKQNLDLVNRITKMEQD